MNRPAFLFAMAFAAMSVATVFLNVALGEARKTIAYQNATIASQQWQIIELNSRISQPE